MADRITAPGVGSERDNQEVRTETVEPFQGTFKRPLIFAPASPARQRQIEVGALAFTVAGLVGAAPEEGIVGCWVGMDRGEGDVGAAVEDVLRSVAVMVVDIEDRDLRAAACNRCLRGDGGIVQVAIAAEIVGAGVMPRRSAQAKGATLYE